MNNIKRRTSKQNEEAPGIVTGASLSSGVFNFGGGMKLPTTDCYKFMHEIISMLGIDSMKKLHYLAGGIFARLHFLGADYDVIIRPSKGGDDE